MKLLDYRAPIVTKTGKVFRSGWEPTLNHVPLAPVAFIDRADLVIAMLDKRLAELEAEKAKR